MLWNATIALILFFMSNSRGDDGTCEVICTDHSSNKMNASQLEDFPIRGKCPVVSTKVKSLDFLFRCTVRLAGIDQSCQTPNRSISACWYMWLKTKCEVSWPSMTKNHRQRAYLGKKCAEHLFPLSFLSNYNHEVLQSRKQVTWGHIIVTDGRAGAPNPHQHPAPTPFN